VTSDLTLLLILWLWDDREPAVGGGLNDHHLLLLHAGDDLCDRPSLNHSDHCIRCPVLPFKITTSAEN
jgi:hypothetical protein